MLRFFMQRLHLVMNAVHSAYLGDEMGDKRILRQ